MPHARLTFLGWDRPALEAAAQQLLARAVRGRGIDLRQTTIVTPGGRADRRLLELLVLEAERQDILLLPPERRTVGDLPELLYHPRLPPAGALARRVAWERALIDCRAAAAVLSRAEILASTSQRRGLARRIEQVWSEISSAGLRFSEVPARLGNLIPPEELGRWEALDEIFCAYRNLLHAQGKGDLHDERLAALHEGRCTNSRSLVLIGIVELRPLVRQMLAAAGTSIESMVIAPTELQDRFDSLGCVDSDAWTQPERALDDEQLLFVDNPAGQARAAADILRTADGRYRADEIRVALCDPQIHPFVVQQFEIEGIALRDARGIPLLELAPVKLLQASLRFLRSGTFSDLGSLLRHPHFEAAVQRRLGWAEDCSAPARADDFYSRRLPASAAIGSLAHDATDIAALIRAAEELLDELRRPLGDLPDALGAPLRYLQQIYQLEGSDTPLHETLLRLAAEWDELARDLSPEVRLPEDATRADLLETILDLLRSSYIPLEPDDEAIDLVGWLELPHDGARLQIVLGFNEGCIPETLTHDSFLPDSIRSALSLPSNRSRFARDAYLLSSLSHRENLRIVCARSNARGESLMPSRLICADGPAAVSSRLRRFYDRTKERRAAAPGRFKAGREATLDFPPRLKPLEKPLTSLTVTAFRDYLSCPYRFYLKHVLRLSKSDDRACEMDPALFGTFAHEILQKFGTAAIAKPIDEASAIASFLSSLLDAHAEKTFGARPQPAVRVQLEQLRYRLNGFAAWQAEWQRQGWRIHAVEQPFDKAKAILSLPDGRAVGLRGTIDRIDFNPSGGRWMIIDYKTAQEEKSPRKTHQNRGAWVDLQLPLYLHCAPTLGLDGEVKAAYYALAASGSDRFLPADWQPEELDDALETARAVLKKILDGDFPAAAFPPAFDDFAVICRTSVLTSDEEELE